RDVQPGVDAVLAALHALQLKRPAVDQLDDRAGDFDWTGIKALAFLARRLWAEIAADRQAAQLFSARLTHFPLTANLLTTGAIGRRRCGHGRRGLIVIIVPAKDRYRQHRQDG